MLMLDITSPKLILNRNIVSSNIDFMINKAQQQALEFRPHFKTHQSIEIANMFKNRGVTGITVSSIYMAKYFIDNGWRDVTIAIPFNILETDLLNQLAKNAKITILIVTCEVLKHLEQNLNHNISAYIEIDTGQNRSGLAHNDYKNIDALIDCLDDCKKIEFHGFYSHSGHTYNCRSKQEILKVGSEAVNKLNDLYQKYKSPICFGDTPSCSVLNDFGNISQISPGNFVFYDWMQVVIGACSYKDIAVALFCPVIAKYESRKEILVHAGAVHLSKEYLINENNQQYFGMVAQNFDTAGTQLPKNNIFVKSLSQEHGVIKCDEQYFNAIKIGDVIPILPIHSCLTADLMAAYLDLNGSKIDHLSAYIK